MAAFIHVNFIIPMKMYKRAHPQLSCQYPSSAYAMPSSKPAFLQSLPFQIRHSYRPRATVTTMSTAPHKVGILDCRLPETHSPTIRLRIYYPTSSPTSTPAPWLPNHPFTNDQSRNILSFLTLPTPIQPFLRPVLTSLSQQPLPASNAPPILPGALAPVLFSHGLGGSTGGYATFCINLAAKGRVVIAPEHSDGSAFVAYTDHEHRIPYVRYNPTLHGSDRVFRKRQLDTRLADLRRVIACLNSGAEFVPLETNVKCPRLTLDTSEMIIAGHSFGGATALLFGAEIRPRKVVCLDAWLYPVEHLTDVELGNSDCLFIDMGSGMKQSVMRREELCRPCQGGLVDAVSIKGGLHNNSSDFPARLPHWIAVATGMTQRGSDPERILETQSFVVEKFLAHVEEWRRFREDMVKDGNGDVVVAPVGRARSLAVVRK